MNTRMKVKLLFHNSFVFWNCSLLVSGPVEEFNILATWLTRELIYLLLLIFFPGDVTVCWQESLFLYMDELKSRNLILHNFHIKKTEPIIINSQDRY